MKNIDAKGFMNYLQEVEDIRCRDIVTISDNHVYFVLQYDGETFSVIINVEDKKLVTTDVKILIKFRDTKITEDDITLLLNSLFNDYISNLIKSDKPMFILSVDNPYYINHLIKNLSNVELKTSFDDSLNGFSNDKTKPNTMTSFNKTKNINIVIDDVANELLNTLIKRGYSKLEATDIINKAKDITDFVYPYETLDKINMYILVRNNMAATINEIIFKNGK